MEFSVRRAQAALTETAPIVADEDDAWLGGILYCDSADKRFLVAKRIGLGSTVNLGTWAGKLYYAFVGLVLVVCLAIGPIFGIVDSIPVRLELSGSVPVCLVASHGQSEKYRLDTDAITDVQLRTPCRMPPAPGAPGWTTICRGISMWSGRGTPGSASTPPKSVFSGWRQAGRCIGSPEIPRTTPPPLRRHCNPPFTPDAKGRGSRILAPQPFLFVICPKTQPICKKCYNFFFKNGVLPLTALL